MKPGTGVAMGSGDGVGVGGTVGVSDGVSVGDEVGDGVRPGGRGVLRVAAGIGALDLAGAPGCGRGRVAPASGAVCSWVVVGGVSNTAPRMAASSGGAAI
jgi:hypothetical protein